MRLSRILRQDDAAKAEDAIPLRRVVFWVLVWIGITIGIVLYFRYARLLTPLLG